MSTEFNFGALEKVQGQSTSKPRLKPWDIYDVKFAGCRVEHIQGKKDPNKVYDILKVRFENEDGYYEESVFFPREEDTKRRSYTTKEGHEREMPSNFENVMTFIAQLVQTITPEGYKKMQAVSSKFKTFDDVCKILIKFTDPFKDKFETKLKLSGRTDKDGNVNAVLPRFTALNKNGELFTSDNFIGDKVAFTAYEEGERRKFFSAKPTDMSKVSNKGSEDLDMDTNNDDINSIDTDDLLDNLL